MFDTLAKSAKKFLSHEASPFAQFIKYAAAGGIATGVHILVFFLAGWFLFPCLTQDDLMVKLFGLTAPDAGTANRALNASLCSTLGFLFSNAVCYLLNRLFVFTPGRHKWYVEILLFYAASGASLVFGTLIQTTLIQYFGIQTTLAFASNIFTALLINYAARKFFVFKG